MAHWLMKSEPSAYSWQQLVADGRTHWSGVRNHQANNNMKAMAVGDEAFFYHSNDERAVVGIMRIVKLWSPDPEDDSGIFGQVDVVPVKPLTHPVTLAMIKTHPDLISMAFVRQSRLSVSPVTIAEWREIMKMGGTSRS